MIAAIAFILIVGFMIGIGLFVAFSVPLLQGFTFGAIVAITMIATTILIASE